MRLILAVLALCASLSALVSASEPRPVLDLLNRVPAVPATAADALKWFDTDGTLVHPEILALKADIDANTKPGQAIASKDGAASAATMAQGLETVGIDMARMQRDPAYAKDVQARVQKMSPQEQMAFMQKMMQPFNQAAVGEVRAMAAESPAVEAAVETAKGWSERQLARINEHAALVRDMEQAAARSAQRPYGLVKPKMEYDSIGCDTPCLAQWKTYGEKLWPLVLARQAEILAIKRASLDRDRAALAALAKEGDHLLVPVQFGRAAQSQTDRAWINGYHEGLLGEVKRLVDETETAARRAAEVVNAGVERLFWSPESRSK